MKKLTIYIDLDGVLACIFTHWIYLMNRYHGESLKIEDITDYSFYNHFKYATKDDMMRFLFQAGFFRHLPAIQGGCETVSEWIKQGHDVHIVTKCHYNHNDKIDWLKDHIPELDLEHNLHFTAMKHKLGGKKGADIFIDDFVDNLVNYRNEHPTTLVVCYDTNYNREWDGARVNNWAQLRELVGRISFESV